MRALVQRVTWAEVEAEGEIAGRIEHGLLVYVGVGTSDTPADAAWLAEKIVNLRIFEDPQGKLNLSVRDVGGGVLAISNFTLLGDARKGRRPAFTAAAPFEQACRIHEAFLDALDRQAVRIQTGVFGASMAVRSQAAGPVNVLIDTSPGTESKDPGDTGPAQER